MQYNRIRGISDRTVRRLLNRNGYYYLQARKKGLMSASDRMKRVAFARRIINNYLLMFRQTRLRFTYIVDGVSFVYKSNPMDQACAPHGRIR